MEKHDCRVVDTLSLVTGKWKPFILWCLLFENETLRFGQLKRQLPGVSQKVLTQQLRELERDRVIYRKVYAEAPPRVEYSITNLGKTLKPVIETISDWGNHHLTTVQHSEEKKF